MNEFFFFFFFEEKKNKRKKNRTSPDYEKLYARLQQGPMTFAEIEEMSGVQHSGVAQVITTLSLRYPVWSPRRGVYKLMGPEDFE